MISVEQAERFADTLAEIATIFLERLGPANVDFPKIEGRLTIGHPLRQRPARAPRRGDADRIESRGNPVGFKLWRFAKVVAVIRRKALRAIEEGVDARCLQHGHALHGHLQDRLEMLEILWELVKAEILGDAINAPWLGFWLESTKQHLAGIFFVVGALVGYTEHRQLRQPVDRFGDDVEVLASL